jgi:GT2 family glycosyltransferase
VIEGWVDRALDHFRDRRIASVAPLIVDAEAPERVLSAGLEYHCGGACRQRGRGISAGGAAAIPGDPIGPSIAAGFYRRSALGDARPLFDLALGPELADVDLALRLREAGYRTVCEPSALVLQPRDKAIFFGGFTQARQAERLFWRHLAANGWHRSLGSHSLFVAREMACSLPHPRAATQIAGRLLAACEWGRARRQRLRFALPPLIAEKGSQRSDKSLADSAGHRLDRPHFNIDGRPSGVASNCPREETGSPLSDKRL